MPPDYRALRAAEVEHARSATRAQVLFAQLGRPPAWPYRALAGWFSPGALAVGMFPASFLVGVFIVYGGMWALSWVAPVNLIDVTSELTGLWASVFAGVVFVWAGALLGVAGTRRAATLGPLQAALAATPNERPGGSALCRLCGAALTYGPHDLGVRCAFCRADNLLKIPVRWAKALKNANAQVGTEIESVERAWHDELARLRLFRKRFALGLTLPTALFLWMFWGELGNRYEDPESWQAATAGDGKVVVVTAARNGAFWYSKNEAVALSRGQTALALQTTGPYCSDVLCRVYVRIPARRGETWAVTCDAGEVPVRVEVHRGFAPALEAWQSGWPGAYGPRVVDRLCSDGASFTATRTGWHLVGVELAGGEVERPVQVTVQRIPEDP